jgi:HSP20 family molecular chaperone IbpA
VKKYRVSWFVFLFTIVSVSPGLGQDGGFGFSGQWGAPGGGLGNIFSAPGIHELGSLSSLRQSDFDPMVRGSLSAFDTFFDSFLEEAKRPVVEDLISRFRISEEEGEVIVEVQVAPGTEFEHITVTPKGDLLRINVEKTEGYEETEGPFTTRIEWHRESFTHTEPLPEGVQTGKMATGYKEQILRMVFPAED